MPKTDPELFNEKVEDVKRMYGRYMTALNQKQEIVITVLSVQFQCSEKTIWRYIGYSPGHNGK